MSAYELAELNVGVIRAPLDSPLMAQFVANLERIINISVWRDVEALRLYVYGTAHAGFMRRRREWFDRMAQAYMVLWWVPRGHRPTVEEALAKLGLLRERGPTADAFTFRQAYPAPDAGASAAPIGFDDTCPAT